MSRVLLTAWLLLMCANNSVICYLTSNRRNYQKILLDDHVVERIHLLSPSNLLANRKCDGSDTLNNSCSRDLDFLKRDLPQRKEWALKMMDSSSKPQSGFLNGFFINIGSYDQCISINENLSNNVIRGRHCMYAVNPTTHKKPFPYNPVISICLPASCNSENVAELVNTTANQNELLKIIELEWVFCSPLDSEKSDDGIGFIILFLIALYVCFLGVCTVCHMHRKILFSPETINSKLFQSLCNLSFAKNNRIIFDTKVDESHLSIINGIRVISTAWIVLSHEYIFDLFQVNINLLDLLKFYSSWKSLIPLIGIFSVDTFLAMSGFLMTYTFFKKMNKKVNFSIYQYYIHRYIRLTAPVAVVLAIMMYVYPSVGSGPRWDWFLRIFVTGIREKWWSILLYLQNYIDKDNLCVLHLWSLAVDMQLYWISPLILFPLHRKPKLGITIVLALCVASIVASGAIVAVNQYPAIYATHEPDMELIMSEFRDVYITTHTRASPWCIGIIFGYAVVTKRKRPSKATMWCGWLATISALIFCLYSSRYFTDTNYVYDIVREVIFASLARPAWAFAICWLVYASAHDCAGPITNILSWKYFQPLSRLSYCIYLVHVVFPLARASTTRTPTFFHDYITWQSCICDLFLSIVMAWGVSITFEVPILALENMIINLRAARSRERKDE